MNDLLYQHLLSCLEYHRDPVLEKFVKHLQEEFGDSIMSILFYGSCMRSREYQDAMLDFYIVVDGYKNAFGNWIPALANKLLPPNVYYLQVEQNNEVYRAKYAVISKVSLERCVANNSFHSYFWARFTQPISYIYLSDTEDKHWIAKVQHDAANTFSNKVIPMLQGECGSEQLWVRGLQLTYSAELRTETGQRAISLYKSNQQYFDEISDSILSKQSKIKVSKYGKLFSHVSWRLRIVVGKLLSVLRLMKASITFANGVDYIAWKIERHTGEKIEVSDNLRKHPWIYSWPMLIRLYRSKKIR